MHDPVCSPTLSLQNKIPPRLIPHQILPLLAMFKTLCISPIAVCSLMYNVSGIHRIGNVLTEISRRAAALVVGKPTGRGAALQAPAGGAPRGQTQRLASRTFGAWVGTARRGCRAARSAAAGLSPAVPALCRLWRRQKWPNLRARPSQPPQRRQMLAGPRGRRWRAAKPSVLTAVEGVGTVAARSTCCLQPGRGPGGGGARGRGLGGWRRRSGGGGRRRRPAGATVSNVAAGC